MFRYKFKVGDTACFDPFNKTHQKESATAYIVQIVGRTRSLNGKYYYCVSNQTGRKYTIKEHLLAPFKFTENNVFIRYPETFPEIDNIDILCIEQLLDSSPLTEKDTLYRDVKAIIAKLKYYEKLSDV